MSDHRRRGDRRRTGSFRCVHCRLDVSEDAPRTAHRNHCPTCLWSRHVDDDKPGDRDADCGSQMEPIGITVRAVKLYAELEKSAKTKLDQNRHSRASIVTLCTKRITGYRDGSLDIAQNKNADLYLRSLASASSSQPYKVPTLAGTLKPASLPGRSQYNLEKTLLERGCANAEILTLRNEWPYEVYGAFCDNKKSVFVSGEWGECESQ